MTTGRFSYNLLPSVEERQSLHHLRDIDHRVVQLLTEHGPNKSYLLRFRRSDTDIICEDCGGIDEAFYPILHCPTHEDLRNTLHSKAIEVGETPWKMSTLLRPEKTFEALKAVHTKVSERRLV